MLPAAPAAPAAPAPPPPGPLYPVPGVRDCYYALQAGPERLEPLRHQLEPLLAQLVAADQEALGLAEQLADRYEEIDLLYSISEILAHAHRLDLAAQQIVRQVGEVFGCRRVSILVHDPAADVLRPVAGWGVEVRSFAPIPTADPCSVAARAFREARPIREDGEPVAAPRDAGPAPAAGGLLAPAEPAPCPPERGYRGRAFLAVPIVYAEPGVAPRPIGVVNLTEREGEDAFSAADERLLAAIASQIGAALENARLVEQDVARQRLERELELARDLQRKLLGPVAVPGVAVAARCLPAASVGGDFYRVLQLPGGTVGVMLGDVSSHGFAAALIMALALSAAGIHAAATQAPDEVLRRLEASVAGELEETEMYLSVFYGVVDSQARRLRYANAGHPHAFRVDKNGAIHRLEATSPPLGLGAGRRIGAREAPWKKGDLLLVFSDGLLDGSPAGWSSAERELLRRAVTLRQRPAAAIAEALLATAASDAARDDRTVVVLKA